jgi:hypothetical protein
LRRRKKRKEKVAGFKIFYLFSSPSRAESGSLRYGISKSRVGQGLLLEGDWESDVSLTQGLDGTVDSYMFAVV